MVDIQVSYVNVINIDQSVRSIDAVKAKANQVVQERCEGDHTHQSVLNPGSIRIG